MSRAISFRTARILGLAMALTLASSARLVRAGVALSFTGGEMLNTADGSDMTLGWKFRVNQAIQVTALGFWDSTPSDPLFQSHQVGLWTSGGTLLGSTTVQTTDPLTGSSRYAAVTPFGLNAGGEYFIGALYYSPFPDLYTQNAATVTTAPEITHLGDARSGNASGFAFPSIVTSRSGRFGPNFQFDIVPTAVPEPSTLAMGGTAVLLGLGYARRRCRTPAA